MAKIKNIVATVWEYEDKNWETKKQYVTMWKLIIKDDKISMKIDCIPVWRNGRAGVYDITEKQKWETKKEQEEDVPF